MTSVRIASYAATGIAIALTGLAAWLIIGSPGTVDDVEPYAAPSRTIGAAVSVDVEDGEGPVSIGENLETAGVIDSDVQFRVLVSLMGYDRLLQAGSYEFAQGSTALEVIYRMRLGIVSTRSVTVVEGWQLGEIADAVARPGISREEFLAAARSRDYDFDFVRELPEGLSLEGYLYPATYSLRASDTPQSIVQRMLDAFAQNVPAGIRDQAAEHGLNLHEVVTIASIIEREAVQPQERPVMAQVFLTRLRIGISLGADPTVQYALAQDPANVSQFGYWKQPLTLDDLEYDSPYNTYANFGVPPGPISSPGLDSMTAVVQPAATNFLYFVAKPDGSHAFAETLDEHLANVELYQNAETE